MKSIDECPECGKELSRHSKDVLIFCFRRYAYGDMDYNKRTQLLSELH